MQQYSDVPPQTMRPSISRTSGQGDGQPLNVVLEPVPQAGSDAQPASPDAFNDRAYRGRARRDDTPAALALGLLLSAIAAWWVAETLFGLIRDWSR